METNKALATKEQILAFLAMANARPQDHGTEKSVLDNALSALKVVRYETEKGISSFEVESFKGVRVSKKTGREIATFVVKGGEYRSLFTNQIQF
jgi:hypothetical protein